MTLNFPNAPTNGQVYAGYVWNASVGAWQILNVGAVYRSTTAPPNPYLGQLWFNETNKNVYVAVDFGSGLQWITANAGIVNTDSNSGRMIYVGSVNPSGSYSLQTGDVWIEV
jgi:hypothetical protein